MEIYVIILSIMTFSMLIINIILLKRIGDLIKIFRDIIVSSKK
jgi:hypothetical protein